MPLANLNRLMQIRAWDEAHRGDADAAMESFLMTLRVSQRLEQSQGNEFFYSVASGWRRLAMGGLRGVTGEFKPSAAELHRALQQLEATRPDKSSVSNFLREEFQNFSHLLDHPGVAFRSNKTNESQVTVLIGEVALRIPFLFHPNRTRRLDAEATRDAIAGIDLPPGYPGDLRSIENVRTLLGDRHGNVIGAGMLLSQIGLSYDFILDRRLKAQSEISATEAFLALVLYHREHGELPATLDALVPDYLPAVPRDYFDGQPIHYSRDFRALWSIGTNQFTVDAVAMDANAIDGNGDLYVPLDFAAPAAVPASRPAP